MILDYLKLKNFRSYGNNYNYLHFTKDGGLFRIVAPNGGGKTSLLFAIDFALFGKVKGRHKFIKNSLLPNRMNKNLEVEIAYSKNENAYVIERGLSPSIFKYSENNYLYDSSEKHMFQNKIDEIVEFDIDTWKSFISLNVDSFKNFLFLTSDEKDILLERIFNLDLIKKISSMIKEKERQILRESEMFNRDIETNTETLNNLQKRIENFKKLENEKLIEELEILKGELLSKKDLYSEVSGKIEKCKDKEAIIANKIKDNDKQLIEYLAEYKKIKEQLELYDKDKCPTCKIDFTTNTDVLLLKKEIENKNVEIIKMIKQLKRESKTLQSNEEKMRGITEKYKTEFIELKSFLVEKKKRIEKLNKRKDKKNSSDIEILDKSIKELEDKIDSISKKSVIIEKDKKIIKEVSNIFSTEKIKKSIISSIIRPMNSYISENIDTLCLPYDVVLDNNFTASIEMYGEKIDDEVLSDGEIKKVNIAIMVAYLKLIRSKRYINILFLDEVFTAIDNESIYTVLELLQKFAKDMKINIFFIQHGQFDNSYFDKVITVEKDIVSNILDED